jgi:polyisoprenoid-binding protein YceI
MNPKRTITREIRRQSVLAVLLLVGGVLLSAGEAHRRQSVPSETRSAAEIVLSLDASRSKAHYTLGTTLHTVHGTFAFKSGSVRVELDSGKASGEIIADATSGKSGDEGRDKKMHKDVLQSARYTEVVFRPDLVAGKVSATGPATVQVHGMFTLHGTDHDLTVPVQAELAADHWKGTAKFQIPYVAWGLKNPGNFFLKADSTVNIELELSGAVQTLQDKTR